jgi:hypothetical protein
MPQSPTRVPRTLREALTILVSDFFGSGKVKQHLAGSFAGYSHEASSA